MTELLSGSAPPSDAELIACVRGGDLAAYGQLYERHVEAARRLARQLMRGSDVDDLVADAFARTLRVLQKGGGPDASFRAYLLTSVRRLHVDRIRAARRVQPSDDLTALDPGVDFDDTAVAGFESGAAAKAFSALPERWQLVLWHLEVEGQKPADVAPLLGMSPNAVSALAYRAREGLRQAYLTMHLRACATDDCHWVVERLGGFVRQGLSRRDAAKVEVHLDGCRSCTAMHLELTDVNSRLGALIGPVVLGAAAAAYATSSAGAGLAGITALAGRLRDAVGAQLGGGATASGTGGLATGSVATGSGLIGSGLIGGGLTAGGLLTVGGIAAAGVAVAATAAFVVGPSASDARADGSVATDASVAGAEASAVAGRAATDVASSAPGATAAPTAGTTAGAGHSIEPGAPASDQDTYPARSGPDLTPAPGAAGGHDADPRPGLRDPAPTAGPTAGSDRASSGAGSSAGSTQAAPRPEGGTTGGTASGPSDPAPTSEPTAPDPGPAQSGSDTPTGGPAGAPASPYPAPPASETAAPQQSDDEPTPDTDPGGGSGEHPSDRGQGNGHGNDHGNGHGHGQGRGHEQGHGHADGKGQHRGHQHG